MDSGPGPAMYAFPVATLHDVRIPTTRADGRPRTLPAALALPDAAAHSSSADDRSVPGVVLHVRTYPEAGHSFMNVRTGLSDRIGRLSPMRARYVETASEDAWRRMLAFFGTQLAPPAGDAQPAAPS